MDLITTHVNADFDALGSLVAAKKLYPDSRLLLPGSQEDAVREFLSLAKEMIIVESEKTCRMDDIDRLILVDTRHKSRIGTAAELVDKGVEVHIYDHHPRMKGDMVADKDVYEEVGATITILADIIKNKKIKLTYLEATLMLLGIYEETGSLTFRSTTKLDVDMVSFLLSKGANLAVVSSYLNRKLSDTDLSLLTKLINTTKRVTIKGISVSLIEIDNESYVAELGTLIQKLMEIENIPVLFVFIKTPHGRIDIIGRSNISSVDVNKILSNFGGGGHPAAASGKIHGENLESIRRRLIEILESNIKVRIYAKDIMSKDVKTVDADTRISDVKNLLFKERVDGLPVSEDGDIIGIITLDGINKAVKRGFGHSRVKGYMLKTVIRIKPDTPLHVIQKMLLNSDVGVLLVSGGEKAIGLIHRTAVLKSVYDDLFFKSHNVTKKIVLNLSKKMSRVLPADIVRLLKKIGNIASSYGSSAFVVGGLVRDLTLGVKNLDLDIVVEGDAIKLGHALARELKASIVVHKRFGTCSVITRKSLKIDLATARKEIYERPAALPTVEFSSLKDDLIRRDFTINAMAVSLGKANFGQLIDFFGGEHDLAIGRIKVMHDGSFIDDPTRIFRAVRFETRFGFLIDNHTQGLVRGAIEEEMFARVEPQRIRDEVILILKEKDPVKAIKRMSELDELKFLHPKIKFTKAMSELYKSIDETCAWYDASGFRKRAVEKWLIYLMALFKDLGYNDVLRICNRYIFRRGDRLRITSYKNVFDKVVRALGVNGILPSKIYRCLEPLSFEVILIIMAATKSKIVKTRIRDFFQRYNGVRVRIKGGDIEAMGLKPCPDFKTILTKVLYEKLNGKLKTERDELEFARKLVRNICG